jgi:DNA primase
MNSYSSVKEEIRRAADIVDLVGQFVKLKKAGQNYVGLCPFHPEKAPSFTVSPSKQMFHCFGCKKGGDIFAFWMEYHKVSFPEAQRDLADRYQLSHVLENLSPSVLGAKDSNESLLQINELASEYYHDILMKSPKGSLGREYLQRRSIPEEVISEFRLGYAPDVWDGLTRYLNSKSVDMEKAVHAGLLIPKKSGGYYDRFRSRILFTILNMRKQIVGFGGRVLDDSLPKYLNTPETAIFHKGRLLYGLHAAFDSIRRSGRVVIVEGYTDVLALHKLGFREAIGTLGTALTRDHIRKIKGYAKEAVVVFDADAAGKTAALKSLPYFLDESLPARVSILPEGDDPDSFVNGKGLASFLDLLDRSIPMFEFFIDLQLSSAGDAIEGKVSALQEIFAVLDEVDNLAQCAFYIKQVSERLGIHESVVTRELTKWKRHRSQKADRSLVREGLIASTARRRDDYDLLNLFIHYPHTMEMLVPCGCDLLLSDPAVMDIFDVMYEAYGREAKASTPDILNRLESNPAKERFREAMLSPPVYQEDMVEQAVQEFRNKIERIRIAESIDRARSRGDLEGLNQLLKLKSDQLV